MQLDERLRETPPEQARRWAWAGVVGPAVFTLGIVVGGANQPGYSHVRQFASELAADGSDVQVMMTAAFVVFGVCTLLFAASLRVLWPTATALAVILALTGLGTLLAGANSCDAGCPNTGARSSSQRGHDGSSLWTFIGWMALSFVAGWLFRHVTYGKVSLALGTVQLVAVNVLAGYVSDRQPNDPVGTWQRIFLVATAVWFVMTVVALRSGLSDRSRGSRR